MTASLNGIRVIDMSHVIAGPLTSYFLAQLGAEVLKIEKPISGDVLRANRESIKTDTPTGFSGFNLGKKSLAIDFHTQEGADAIRELAKDSHVFIENFRPGSVKKYGLDYESIKKINPKISFDDFQTQFIGTSCSCLKDYIKCADRALEYMQTKEELDIIVTFAIHRSSSQGISCSYSYCCLRSADS